MGYRLSPPKSYSNGPVTAIPSYAGLLSGGQVTSYCGEKAMKPVLISLILLPEYLIHQWRRQG